MRIRSMNSWHVRVGSVLLTTVAAAALSAAAAQEPTAPNSLATPPAVALTLGEKGQDNSSTSATLPAAPPSQTDAGAPVTTAPASEPSSQPAASVPADTASPAATVPASEPAAALPALDAALKDALDDLAAKELPHGSAGAVLRSEHAAIVAFYTNRNYAPLWIADGNWTEAANSALARLKRADEDGLEIKASALPVLGQGDPAALAASELALSEAVVDYGRQASGGRIDPRSISPFITEKPAPAEPAEILTSVASAADAGSALENFNPPQAGYKALRKKLTELRRSYGNVADHIPDGPVLKLGMKDSRVLLIRARFDLGPDAQNARSGLLYDTKVADAVADFQRSSGLPVSGTLTTRTVAALSNGQPTRLENEILVNMERWRWMAHEIEPDQVDVNVFFTSGAGRVYATALNSLSMNALTYITAQAKADVTLLRGIPFSGLLLLFSTGSCEVWQDAALPAPNFPYSRLAILDFGLIQPTAIAGWETGFSELLWVGQDAGVHWMTSNSLTQTRVSRNLDRLIEAEVRAGNTIEAGCYIAGGKKFLVVSSPDWTWEFNLQTKKWNERWSLTSSGIYGRWRGTGGHPAFGKWLLGDQQSGNLLFTDDANRTEIGAPILWRMESPGQELPGAKARGARRLRFRRRRRRRGWFDLTLVTGAAAGANGVVRLGVASTASMRTQDTANVSGVSGTTEANGAWVITIIDATHIELQGSVYVNAYSSGGTVIDVTSPSNAQAPTVAISMSKDGGQNWGNPLMRPLGAQASVMRSRVSVTNMGLSGPMGFRFRLDCTDQVYVSFMGATVSDDVRMVGT